MDDETIKYAVPVCEWHNEPTHETVEHPIVSILAPSTNVRVKFFAILSAKSHVYGMVKMESGF